MTRRAWLIAGAVVVGLGVFGWANRSTPAAAPEPPPVVTTTTVTPPPTTVTTRPPEARLPDEPETPPPSTPSTLAETPESGYPWNLPNVRVPQPRTPNVRGPVDRYCSRKWWC